MPDAPSRPCKHPGCGGSTEPRSRWCAKHQRNSVTEETTKRAVLDARRGSAHARGYDARWAALSRLMRTRFPISHGYLTRTQFWTPGLAAQFHALRLIAVERSEFAGFFSATGAGARWLELFPIYEFHASARAEGSAVTDHIIPHRGDHTLFWAEWNLQAIGKSQHDEKTARFDGGFRGAQGSPRARHSPTGDGGPSQPERTPVKTAGDFIA